MPDDAYAAGTAVTVTPLTQVTVTGPALLQNVYDFQEKKWVSNVFVFSGREVTVMAPDIVTAASADPQIPLSTIEEETSSTGNLETTKTLSKQLLLTASTSASVAASTTAAALSTSPAPAPHAEPVPVAPSEMLKQYLSTLTADVGFQRQLQKFSVIISLLLAAFLFLIWLDQRGKRNREPTAEEEAAEGTVISREQVAAELASMGVKQEYKLFQDGEGGDEKEKEEEEEEEEKEESLWEDESEAHDSDVLGDSSADETVSSAGYSSCDDQILARLRVKSESPEEETPTEIEE